MSDEENEDYYSDSDNEVNSKNHQNLLENLVGLDSKQPVKKATRTEPTLEISEYNLVKSITGNRDSVKLHELTKPLRDRTSHREIGKKIKKADRKTKTLEKPLEKPQAEKVRRTVAYDKVKEEIGRWEPVVTSHRASTYLSFPLNTDTKVEIDKKQNVEWNVKSDLDKAIEELEHTSKTEIFEVEPDPDEPPLTLREMIERRKEMARLRRFQSYREMKARAQNKIKSKKYRRALRKERAKAQAREFEEMRKNDPEAALKKLDEIEASRARERASLRHKSTGKWAKDQQIRAKYDKESRQVLAEQLAISKQLTQKKNVESSDSEDEKSQENRQISNADGDLEFNFWTSKIESTEKKSNGNDGVDVTYKYLPKSTEVVEEKEDENVEDADEEMMKKVEENIDDSMLEFEDKIIEEKLVKKSNSKSKKRKRKPDLGSAQNEKKIKLKKKKTEVIGMSGAWTVDEDYVDELANKLEDKLKGKLLQKSKKMKERLETTNKNNKTKPIDSKTKKIDLTLKKQIKHPIIDEALYEETAKNSNATHKIKPPKNPNLTNTKRPNKPNPANGIEPNKYLKVKPVQLDTSQPDLFATEDNEEEANFRGLITEAFRDEDIAADFAKTKREDIEKDTPKDLDLFLPGWGAWGGTEIKTAKKKRNRFVTKTPRDLPRKDGNRGELVVNEKGSRSMKGHMVSEVPFPFRTSEDYEATIRAPVGSTFVPETAFRRHTRPAVTTKLGTVIEPVDEDVLMRKMRKFERVFKGRKGK